MLPRSSSFFFFNDTPTTEIYTLSLHDALPIYGAGFGEGGSHPGDDRHATAVAAERYGHAQEVTSPRRCEPRNAQDRKSTRLNSSHGYISYAVFCLKKKKKNKTTKIKKTQ